MDSERIDEIGEDCGCAPTPAERRALWPQQFTRRTALSAGILGIAGAALLAAPQLPAAYAADYPSWDDVVRARKNQAAKAKEVSRVEGLIQALADNVNATRAVAEQRAAEFFAAQQAFFDASSRADELQQQADEQAATAKDAADQAGRLAAQLYRDGGDGASLELFFTGSAAGADDLLAKLGRMDRLMDRNRDIYAKAVTARDAAQSFSDQAAVARTERDRLQKIAEQKMDEAQAAADAAQAALDAQTAHLEDLEAQLAALKDTTAKTVAGYKAGVEARRKAREERLRREREEAERRAKEQGGGKVLPNGWCRPNSGVQTYDYGPRNPWCGPSYCASSYHQGVDLADSCGSAIFAAHAGTVVYAGPNGGYGNYIKIDHGSGIGTGYAHIRGGGIYVRRGDQVRSGELIAAEGNTGNSFGCHLHFEVYEDNRPINPTTFMRARGISV